MSAGGGDLECALGLLLAFDFLQIRVGRCRVFLFNLGGRQQILRTGQMATNFQQTRKALLKLHWLN